MAKGILGDDGPSVWTFVAVILFWGWLKGQFNSGKKSVVDTLEIGQNSGGPLQPETTAQISAMQAFVNQIPVTPSRLRYKLSYYQSVADTIWDELISPVNIDEPKLFALLGPMSVYELRAVAKSFGIKEPGVLGLTVRTLTIFKAFEWKLTDGIFGNDLYTMRKIWGKTGLWY